jgi:hypothetical protein
MEALIKAQMTLDDIDVLGDLRRTGGALLVGLAEASIAYAKKITLVGVFIFQDIFLRII